MSMAGNRDAESNDGQMCTMHTLLFCAHSKNGVCEVESREPGDRLENFEKGKSGRGGGGAQMRGQRL